MNIKQLQKLSHKIAVEKGFWDIECDDCNGTGKIEEIHQGCGNYGGDIFGFNPSISIECKKCKATGKIKGKKNLGEKIALMHTELSEALEGLRQGNPQVKRFLNLVLLKKNLPIVLFVYLILQRRKDIIWRVQLKLNQNITERDLINMAKNSKKEIVILIGNVGSGKSTLAKKYFKKGYIIIARDMLRYAIGGGEYVFNYDYEPVIWKTELYMFNKFLELDVNILIDEVGVSRSMRERYIKFIDNKKYNITAVELKRISKKEAVKRKMNVPHGQPDKKLWSTVWEKFDKQYERSIKKEGFDRIIRLKK